MFNFDQFGRIAISALGSIILTVTAVGAAVGPARAIETSPITGYEASSSAQLNA